MQGLSCLPQAIIMPVTCHFGYGCGSTPTLNPGSRDNGKKGASATLAKLLEPFFLLAIDDVVKLNTKHCLLFIKKNTFTLFQ